MHLCVSPAAPERPCIDDGCVSRRVRTLRIRTAPVSMPSRWRSPAGRACFPAPSATPPEAMPAIAQAIASALPSPRSAALDADATSAQEHT